MKIKTFILSLFLGFIACSAWANSENEANAEVKKHLAESGYNSNPVILAKIKKMDDALGVIACIGCHNDRATYTIITKEEAGYKLKYQKALRAELMDATQEFTLAEKDALEILGILNKEISKASGASTHKEGAKRGSSFEYGIKDGDKWKFAGHYSKTAYPIVMELATITKLFDESQMERKMKTIRAEM
ncbi:MAG: hypothetical protein R3Y46_07290 [Opitutales bacterium]